MKKHTCILKVELLSDDFTGTKDSSVTKWLLNKENSFDRLEVCVLNDANVKFLKCKKRKDSHESTKVRYLMTIFYVLIISKRL